MDELEKNSQGGSPDADPATPEASIVEPDVATAVTEDAPVDPVIADGAATEGVPDDSGIADAAAEEALAEPAISVEELMRPDEAPTQDESAEASQEDTQLKAILEAIVYVAEEPLTLAQIAASLQQPPERIKALLDQLIVDFEQPGHGVSIREVAGGYKMATKPEHHEGVRNFVKSLKPPLKLSLPALETLAVIAYKQPATGPEIMEIRGVQGGGVFKTLLDRKLIAVAGRKNVIGKPILYKTTKEFLIQFGLKDLSELPSLKEFEEIRRMAFSDNEAPVAPVEIIEVTATEAAELADEVVAEVVAEAPETSTPEPIVEAPAGEAAAETSEPAPEEPAAEPQVKEEE